MLVVISSLACGQNLQALYKTYQTAPNEKSKLKALLAYSDELRKSNLDSAIKCNQKSILLAKKINDEHLLAEANLQQALCHEYKSDFTASLNCYMNAADGFKRVKYDLGLSKAYTGMGVVYMYEGLYDKAIDYFYKNIVISKQLNDKNGIASSYGNMAIIFDNTGNLDSSLFYYQMAMKIFEDEKNEGQVAACLDNISLIYAQQEKFSSAIENNDKGFKIRKSLSDTLGMMASMENLGLIYIRQKNAKKAIDISLEALKMAQELGAKEDMKYAYINLKDAYELNGDYKTAFTIQEKLMRLKDSLLNAENVAKVAELEARFNTKEREQELNEVKLKQKLRESEYEINRKKKNLAITVLIIGGISISVIAFLMYRRFREKNKVSLELSEKNEAIQAQKRIIDKAYTELTVINKDITDSIKYARSIQKAIFPSEQIFRSFFPHSFIYLKPKDIVSGDFFWITEEINEQGNQLLFLAVCDSTGHGVPGAFMSLLNIGFLSEAIKEKKIYYPNEVFDYVRNRLISSVSKDNQKDGFDGTLVCINKAAKKITYASAYNSPLFISKGGMSELNADRMPVGIGEKNDVFSLFSLNYNSGDKLYLFTDGFADQFGGPKGKKFKYKQLHELIKSVSEHPIDEQRNLLSSAFNNWKNNLEQVDDVCVIGINLA